MIKYDEEFSSYTFPLASINFTDNLRIGGINDKIRYD